ncbi:MAG TPA: beta-propeller domain-containing protein [bacterium]|nr:beta-propeller domain-containing protein [bacterium]
MRSFFKTVLIMVFAFLFIAGCSNSTNSRTDEISDLPDAEDIESPDVKDKDENGEFITAGATNSHDKGNTGDSGEYSDEEAGADDNGTGDDAEREIIESDIYKVEGNTIWVVNQYKGLIAIDMTNPKALKVVGKAPFEGIPGEMYLSDGRAYILVTGLNGKDLDDKEGYYGGRSMSKVIVVNTEKPSAPKILGSYEMDGTIVDSRQVGDVIYVAATQNIYYWYWCDTRDEYGKDQITLMSINVADPANIKKVDEVSLEGTAYTIYVSTKSIYVAEANYDYWNNEYNQKYPVTLFDISDPAGKIVKKGKFETDGFMSDRWKMYEKGDVFFAVSQSDQWGNGSSMVESFDISDPAKITQIDKFVFMEGQMLYGTKFEGDRLYAVTYMQKDPLHVLDISDPENLKELGQLAVPGWSTHLEIRGDRILTVGIDDTDNWKTKVSMYDVSDPANPKEMNTIAIGTNYSYSEATQDWKAFKIYDDLGLILLPVNEYDDTSWRYVYRLHLIDFDLEKGLTQRGSVESDSPVMRGVALDNMIISIGDRHVMMIDATDRDKPEILSTAVMAYFVGNLNTCGNQLCGVDNDYYNQPSTLVTYEAGNDTNPVKWRSGKMVMDYGYSDLMKSGDKGYLITNSYGWYGAEDGEAVDMKSETESQTAISILKILKFSDNNDPEELALVPLMAPDDSYSAYYSSSAVTENGVVGLTIQNWNYFYPESDCYSSEPDCAGKGEGYSMYNSKVIVYDVSKNKSENAVPVIMEENSRTLDYDSKIIANGTTLWFTECKQKGYDDADREILYCYAVPIDAKDPTKPVIGEKVNIPGKIIGMSDDGEYLYTSHVSWNEAVNKNDGYNYYEQYIRTLYILKFNDDRTKVSVVKKISIPSAYESTEKMYRYQYSDFIVKDNRVFIGTNETVYNYEENECSYWYYSNRETTMNVQIFRAEDGHRLYSKTFENGARYSSVEGGGFLLSIEDNENVYYGYSDSSNMIYISKEGVEKEITLPEKTYGWYSYSLSAAVIDDVLYIARDWNGIEKVSLK